PPITFGGTVEEMEHLGDDRIGRALDRLFDADRAALLTDVVLAVGQAFALKFEELHNDSTTVSFCGAYRAAWLISNDRKLSPAQVLEAHKGQPMIEKRFEQTKTVHEIAPVLLKNEGRIEALFTLYLIALL